jgi:hypothetical protein
MVDEDVVLGRDVEVLVAFSTGLREVDRVDRGSLGGWWKDVVVTVAAGAVGHVLTGTESRAAMRLVLLRGIFVTASARLATNEEWIVEVSVRHRGAVPVAVEALESVVRRMRDIVGKYRIVAAGLVTLGAGRAVDRFVLVLLSNRGACGDRAGENDGDDGAKKEGLTANVLNRSSL